MVPGEGVRLEAGRSIRARAVVSNADPKRTLALCEHGVPDAFARRVARLAQRQPRAQDQLRARAGFPVSPPHGPDAEPHRAMVTISTGVDATQAAYEASRRGEPDPAWCELYFQSAYDPSVVPAGGHVMSVFAQYVPYTLAAGTWESRRDEIADAPSPRSPASPPTWPTPSCTARSWRPPTSRRGSG